MFLPVEIGGHSPICSEAQPFINFIFGLSTRAETSGLANEKPLPGPRKGAEFGIFAKLRLVGHMKEMQRRLPIPKPADSLTKVLESGHYLLPF